MTRAPERQARVCPVCGKPAGVEHAPFCSRRCADVDLHRWLAGAYRVETDEAPSGSDFIDPKDRE